MSGERTPIVPGRFDEGRFDATTAAIAAISATPRQSGAIDCPLCKVAGALRFRHQFSRRGRGSRALYMEAKCAKPQCLEFRS